MNRNVETVLDLIILRKGVGKDRAANSPQSSFLDNSNQFPFVLCSATISFVLLHVFDKTLAADDNSAKLKIY